MTNELPDRTMLQLDKSISSSRLMLLSLESLWKIRWVVCKDSLEKSLDEFREKGKKDLAILRSLIPTMEEEHTKKFLELQDVLKRCTEYVLQFKSFFE